MAINEFKVDLVLGPIAIELVAIVQELAAHVPEANRFEAQQCLDRLGDLVAGNLERKKDDG